MKRVRTTSLLALGFLSAHLIADEAGWRAPPAKPVNVNIPVAKPETAPWQPARSIPGFAPDIKPPESLFRPFSEREGSSPPITGLIPHSRANEPVVLPGTLGSVPPLPTELIPSKPITIPATHEDVPIPIIPPPVKAALPIIPEDVPNKLPMVPTVPGQPGTVNAFQEPEKPKEPRMVEPLPPPRLVPDEKKDPTTKPEDPKTPAPKQPTEPVPQPPLGTIVPTGGVVLEPLPGLVQAECEVPTQGRTFGSPELTLSRNQSLRDFFGTNMQFHRHWSSLFQNQEPNGPPSTHSFIRAEYLLWWQNRQQIPVLATTGTPASQGALGREGTVPLLGPGEFGPSLRNGFRVQGGTYFNECSNLGIDGSFFFLGKGSERFNANSNQFPVLSRPFFSENLNQEIREVVAFPNAATGSLDITTDTFLWGADVNIRNAICRTCQGSYGWLTGYRHLNLTENLDMTEFITASGPLVPDPVGTQVVVGDRFRTQNQFHGGQVGIFWQKRYGRFDLDARATVAMGVNHQIITIDGFQERTRPGEQTERFAGGLLATGTNLGTFTANKFSVVPEATINAGFIIAPGVRTYVGYNFLYWSNVVRPGDQIDRTLDETLIPNFRNNAVPASGSRPRVPFKQSDFWAQGVQFGLEFRW